MSEKMARQKGFEPLAYCLEGSCSIQLSYTRIQGRSLIPTAANRQLKDSSMDMPFCQVFPSNFSKILPL